jgi:putative transposase
VADNLLQQQFTAEAPDRIWVTDSTYIRTDEGWLYLAGIKDLYSCEIVGCAMAERMTCALTLNALNKAWSWRRPAAGLIPHSDRGSPQTLTAFKRSISVIGCCGDS